MENQNGKISSLIPDVINQIEVGGDKMSGVPSGLMALDNITLGWQKGDLVVLAARPGMGKTAFALTVARNAAVEFNKPTAIFSLEMSSLQLINRIFSSEAELNLQRIRKGNLEPFEWQELTSGMKAIAKAPLYIDDTPAISISEIITKSKKLKEEHNIELIIIDDIIKLANQDSDNDKKEFENIGNVMYKLKNLARELNIPIIALSQVSRNVEQRVGNRRPLLIDLYGSASIEEVADMVLFIYRPEYYGLIEDENGNPTKGRAEIIIAKYRNGYLENVPLRFMGQFVKFTDLDYDQDAKSSYNSSIEDFLSSGPKSKMSLLNHDIEDPF